MPILSTLASRFRAASGRNGLIKASEVPVIDKRPSIRVVSGFTGGSGAWSNYGYSPVDYVPLVEAGYISNPDVYAAVSLIATAAKQVKWWDGQGNSKAMRSAAEMAKAIGVDAAAKAAHAPFDAAGVYQRELKAATNPKASIDLLKKAGGASYIEAWISYLLLSGNNYTEIRRTAPGSKVITDVYLLRPDLVSARLKQRTASGEVVRPVERELVESWKLTGYGQSRTIPAEDMVHSKLFNPLDDVYGLPPLAAARMRLTAQNAGYDLMARLLNRGFSPGWIEAREDSIWTDVQVETLKSRVAASKLKGEELFLENAKWHQMGFTPVDAGLADQQVLTKRDIASIFHVAPELLGDATSKTYSNFQEARKALYTEPVIPLLTHFRDDWNATIGAALNSPLEFDRDTFDAIMSARVENADRVTKLWQSGLIKQNEGRAELEYDPVPDGDRFFAPANFMPLASSNPNPDQQP